MTRARPSRAAPAKAPEKPRRLAWLDPRAPFLLPAIALVATRLWLAHRIPNAAEDAYITFRYARNLAHGLGPVFNAGERVFGFTSPPWMAWIALGIRLGVDPVPWSRGTLLVADLVTLLATGALLSRHASRRAAWCFGAFLALWPYLAAMAATGLETGALIALLALSAWLVDRRSALAGPALGLLAVFRPEGLVAAVALSFWARPRERFVALGIAAAVFAALAIEFGSPIPQGLLAKAEVYGVPGPRGSLQWWDWAIPFTRDNTLATTSEGRNFFLLALLVAPAAAVGLGALWKERRTPLAGMAAAALLVWAAYAVSGTAYFFWYFVTPLVAWVLLASVGLPRMVNGPWVYVAALVAVAGHWTFEPHLYEGRARMEGGTFGAIGDYVEAKARPGETLMLEPIGTVGWRARDLRVVDEIGLVSPEVAKRRREGAGWYADVLAAERPEWLVVRGALLLRGEALAGAGAPFRSEDERLRALSAYEVAAAGDTTRSDLSLFVLRRKDLGRR